MIRLFIILKDSYKKIGNGGNKITKIDVIITIILIITYRVSNIVTTFLRFGCVSWITKVVIGRSRRLGKGYRVRNSFFGFGLLA